jgi:hypothetical protein
MQHYYRHTLTRGLLYMCFQCHRTVASLLVNVLHFSSLALFLLPWRWRRHVPPICRFIINSHGATSILYQSRMMDDDECGAVGGMSGRGNRSIRRKPTSMPFYLPQITHHLTRARTRVVAVGNRWLIPATNIISYGTASCGCNWILEVFGSNLDREISHLH